MVFVTSVTSRHVTSRSMYNTIHMCVYTAYICAWTNPRGPHISYRWHTHNTRTRLMALSYNIIIVITIIIIITMDFFTPLHHHQRLNRRSVGVHSSRVLTCRFSSIAKLSSTHKWTKVKSFNGLNCLIWQIRVYVLNILYYI